MKNTFLILIILLVSVFIGMTATAQERELGSPVSIIATPSPAFRFTLFDEQTDNVTVGSSNKQEQVFDVVACKLQAQTPAQVSRAKPLSIAELFQLEKVK